MADTANLPRYAPSKHSDDDDVTLVLVELACVCGGLFRRADPVAVIRPDAEEWVAAHQGDEHAPASMSDAIAARSGTAPDAGTEGAADPGDGKVRAWPFDPAAPDDADELAGAATVTPER